MVGVAQVFLDGLMKVSFVDAIDRHYEQGWLSVG